MAYGIDVINKALDILFDAGEVVEDAVEKRPFAAIAPAMDLLSLVKSGVDLKELGNELLDLGPDDGQLVLKHLNERLPELQLPALAAKLSEAANLLLIVGDHLQADIAVGEKVLAFFKS